MDNTDPQNLNSTSLDITPTSDTGLTTIAETTTTSTPVTPQVTVTPPYVQTPAAPVNISISTPTQSETPTQVVVTPSVTPPVQVVPSETTNWSAPVSVEAPVATPMGTPVVSTTTVAPTVPVTAVATPVVTPTAETTTVTTTAEQPLIPQKKGASPLVLGLAAVLFLGVTGVGVFAVSRAISTSQNVAPTAPESQPAAYEPVEEVVPPSGVAVDDGSFDCTPYENTAAYQGLCFPVATDEFGILYWIPQTTEI